MAGHVCSLTSRVAETGGYPELEVSLGHHEPTAAWTTHEDPVTKQQQQSVLFESKMAQLLVRCVVGLLYSNSVSRIFPISFSSRKLSALFTTSFSPLHKRVCNHVQDEAPCSIHLSKKIFSICVSLPHTAVLFFDFGTKSCHSV